MPPCCILCTTRSPLAQIKSFRSHLPCFLDPPLLFSFSSTSSSPACMYEGLLQLLLSFSAFYKIMRGSNNANGTCRNRRIQCFVGLVPPPLLRRGAAWWCDGDGSLCGIASDKRKRGKNGVSSFLKNVSSSFCTYILMARKY